MLTDESSLMDEIAGKSTLICSLILPRARYISIILKLEKEKNKMTETTTVGLPLRLTVKEFAKQIYGNEGGVRNLIFWGAENGFNKCIRRVGKKIFIDVAEYYKWQDEINGQGV